MQVLVDIPESLVKYLEFIPTEDLPNVVISALEEKIFSKSSSALFKEESLQGLLSILGRLSDFDLPTAVNSEKQKQEDIKPQASEDISGHIGESMANEFIEPVVISNNIDDDDDDDDDFMDLMK